jgi:hypothetical protein
MRLEEAACNLRSVLVGLREQPWVGSAGTEGNLAPHVALAGTLLVGHLLSKAAAESNYHEPAIARPVTRVVTMGLKHLSCPGGSC